MTADAYATAFMAMGLEAAIHTASTLPDLDYLLIYADSTGAYQTASSTGMQARLYSQGKGLRITQSKIQSQQSL
jgi:thiamine biosynthesis lipoprotein